MPIDVHSHYWDYPKDFTASFIAQARRAPEDVEVDLIVRHEDYLATGRSWDKTDVFGGKAKLAGLWFEDRDVAAYVARQPDKVIGFLSVDPTQPEWQDELVAGQQDLKMKGINLPALLHRDDE